LIDQGLQDPLALFGAKFAIIPEIFALSSTSSIFSSPIVAIVCPPEDALKAKAKINAGTSAATVFVFIFHPDRILRN
jgi:hypothetical protein